MKWLNQEYPKYTLTKKPWQNGLFAAALIFVLFILFQPFGFRDKEFSLKLVLFPSYGILTFGYTYLHFYIVKHVAKQKNKWSFGKEIQSVLTGIFVFAFVIHVVTYWITGDMPFSFYWYFKLVYHTFSLILILTTLEFLFYLHKSSAYKSEQLAIQNKIIAKKLAEELKGNHNDLIKIRLEKELLEIKRGKIVLIQSTGNYLEFYLYEDNDNIKKLVKRGRMHQAENDLDGFIEFFRCHRAFIVNLNYVERLVGNSKNARMIFNCPINEIPVSRNHFKLLNQKLEKLAVS